MTEKELRESVKNPCGGYFFWGDEDYLKKHYVSVLRKAVVTDEAFAPFNETILDQESFSPDMLRDAILSPPMMAEKKLIRVTLDDYSALPEAKRRELAETYGELRENNDTVLVISVLAGGFDGGTDKRPSAQLKKISANLNAVAFPLQSEAKLLKWLSRHFSEYGIYSGEDALRTMMRICGRSMYRLAGEADKAASYALSRGLNRLTPELISDVAAEAPEEDAFRLANAVLSGDRSEALASLSRAKKRGENPIRLLAAVSAVFCDMAAVKNLVETGSDKREIAGKLKMHEYKTGLYIRAISGISRDSICHTISLCAEADEKMKSSSLGFIPLERLICSAGTSRK